MAIAEAFTHLDSTYTIYYTLFFLLQLAYAPKKKTYYHHITYRNYRRSFKQAEKDYNFQHYVYALNRNRIKRTKIIINSFVSL